MILKEIEPFGGEKYLHCGNCWSILGHISSSKPGTLFDTFDCSWECKKCGRLNLSSDSLVDKRDSQGNIHSIYLRNDEEEQWMEDIPDNFNFDTSFFR